jgi:hypothetical protein
MLRSARYAALALTALGATLLTGCEAVDQALATEPATPANLVVESIEIGDAPANTVVRAKVGTPVRVRVTLRNSGGATAPASVSRAYMNSRRVADFATPEVRRNARVTVEGTVTLERELLFSRDVSANHSVQVCLNATGTIPNMGQEQSCDSSPSQRLLVVPNFELDCAATALPMGAAQPVAPGTPACVLSSLGSWSGANAVRFFDATGPGRFTIELTQTATDGTYMVAVMSEDGGVISTLWPEGTTTRGTFSVSLPGRYYVAVATTRPLTKRLMGN